MPFRSMGRTKGFVVQQSPLVTPCLYLHDRTPYLKYRHSSTQSSHCPIQGKLDWDTFPRILSNRQDTKISSGWHWLAGVSPILSLMAPSYLRLLAHELDGSLDFQPTGWAAQKSDWISILFD